MGKFLVLILVSMVLVLGGCAFTPSATYTEANDATNNVTPEVAGSLASGSLAIKGSLSSSSDIDMYKVSVGSKTTIDFDTLYNGKSQKNALGISLYPFAYTTYDASNVALTIHLLMAGASSETLESGTSYVIYDFYGTSTYSSGTYELDLW